MNFYQDLKHRYAQHLDWKTFSARVEEIELELLGICDPLDEDIERAQNIEVELKYISRYMRMN